MPLPQAAAEHYRAQQRLTVATLAACRKAWAGMGNDFDATWPVVRQRLIVLIAAGQKRAGSDALSYLTAVTDELGLTGPLAGVLSTAPLVGVAADGRPLDTLLDGAVYAAKSAAAGGATSTAALGVGGSWLEMAAWTTLADTSRAGETIGVVSRPKIKGYVRMLNAPACSRCVILAGKFFRWNNGFLRHPRCDCRHIPASEDSANSMTTDPSAYFHSLSKEQQDKTFTRGGAEAVRLGGDLSQVVNARRGLSTATTTTTGTTKRGLAGQRLQGRTRVTPDHILRQANGDRAEAIRLLTQHGYIR